MHFFAARMSRHYGLIHGDRGEFESAVRAYGQAIQSNPAMARAYLERGILYWRELAEPKRALADLNVALQLKPNWPDALFSRAMAHLAGGDYPSAIGDLAAYLTTGDHTWHAEATKQLKLMQAL